MEGPDGSIDTAEYRSLSQKNCNSFVYFVQKSGEICTCFPILFHCTFDCIARHFRAAMLSEILTLCRLHVFHVWYVSITQYFGQEGKLYVDGSISISSPPQHISCTDQVMILVLDTQHFASNFCHNISHRLPQCLKRNFCSICCPDEFQVTYLCITPIHFIAPR